MTEISNEKPENGIHLFSYFIATCILRLSSISKISVLEMNGRFVESNGRTRFSLKPLSHLLRDSDDSDSANGTDLESEDCSESADEWTESSNRKRKRKLKSINVAPVQTLKKKLAEKTKALRKNASKASKPAKPIEPSNFQPEFRVKAEIPVGKQLKIESNEVKVEKNDPKVKLENIALTDTEVKVNQPDPVDIKIKQSETLEVEKPKRNVPVVLTYSMVKDSCNISPFLLASSPSNHSTPSFALSQTPPNTQSLPAPATSPSLTPVPVVPSTSTSVSPNPSLPPNAIITPPVPRIRIRSNLQASPAFRNSLTVPSRPPAPVIPTGPRPRLRTPTPRAPRARAPRTPKTFHRSPVSPVLVNSVGRPQKPLSSPIPPAHSRPFGNIQSPTVSSRTPSTTQTTPNLKDSSSLKNISPTGAVIYSGSNSVTITPRKVVPDKPTVQRKLFKNEIEGIIAVRHEGGILKYVINLANGTHMPLTEHQVTKLREQNGGRLPTKLKIPVPSDVAAKIEPSYLIED
ncbi:hypothetical protein V9T40_005901 [Parthenolecanium corni]|uniref:Uncharacterized protein n=1 Tax=Parthenolecanium corni TaxID=536013 RepID=A0AAN9YBF5_9HEMI